MSGFESVVAAKGTSARGRWLLIRRVADVMWIGSLAIAVPFAPVARVYLLSWPGEVEWSLVLSIAIGIATRTVADRRLVPAPDPSADTGPDSQLPRALTIMAWVGVAILLPLVWLVLVQPLLTASSQDWTGGEGGVFTDVLIGTFLIGPYLVGLLVWWLLRDMSSLAVRLIVATLTACAAGLLAYGSLGYLPPALLGLF